MNKVLKYLKENERSLSWLARKCDVSPTTVHYWSINKNMPSRKHRVIIKDVTGIEVEQGLDQLISQDIGKSNTKDFKEVQHI